MIHVVAIAALLCAAVTFGLSLAHALELPGKSRLDRDTYMAVQTIYYPGFTWGGLIGELGGMVLLAILLLLLPAGATSFRWASVALGLLACVHGAYWLFTHPLNNFWIRDTDLNKAASAFFASSRVPDSDWRTRRDRWERSHVLRAVLAAGSLTAFAIALIDL